MQCTYNGRVRVTIVGKEKQVILNIMGVCASIFSCFLRCNFTLASA